MKQVQAPPFSPCSANAGRALTYAQLGVPVLADATPDIVEQVLGNQLGFVAERRASWELYLRHFLTKPLVRHKMARRSLQYAQNHLSPQSIGLSFIDYLIDTFADRLPGDVVKQCRVYLDTWEEMGLAYDSVIPAAPLDIEMASDRLLEARARAFVSYLFMIGRGKQGFANAAIVLPGELSFAFSSSGN